MSASIFGSVAFVLNANRGCGSYAIMYIISERVVECKCGICHAARRGDLETITELAKSEKSHLGSALENAIVCGQIAAMKLLKKLGGIAVGRTISHEYENFLLACAAGAEQLNAMRLLVQWIPLSSSDDGHIMFYAWCAAAGGGYPEALKLLREMLPPDIPEAKKIGLIREALTEARQYAKHDAKELLQSWILDLS